ncbi:hypothetical protein CVT25_002758 [Psilocybe cyanescens]|uniref:Fido domain-containing protein n=1 Tax=Psilocybe cyanescens TaxID=93625 RepID=A0A409X5Q8_PSICY|nr:hypothetical protein CVT25_002758 [Psilocybe cyanescens]
MVHDSTYLPCFLNVDRPQIQSLQLTLPTDLPTQIIRQINDSLEIDPSDGRSCAATGRLWDYILESHRIPYLMLRVADMRMSMGSKVTALALYDELKGILNNPEFSHWVVQSKLSVQQETHSLLSEYKDSSYFTPSQRWVPTAQHPFPRCRLEKEDLQRFRELWESLKFKNNNEALFLNMHCLETNYIEGTFAFDTYTNDRLVVIGFYDQEQRLKYDLTDPERGAVRSLQDALSILQDTHRALTHIYIFREPEPPALDVQMLCQLHAELMKTSRVLYDETHQKGRLSYTNIGITRQTSRVNVTASSMFRGEIVRVQFCPFDEVEAELDLFCRRFNEIIRDDDMDPFAAAAWISYTFVYIHPFEDGNGRLSRMLASIPLIRQGLPPICIRKSSQVGYIANLNKTREMARHGDYKGLMRTLFTINENSLALLLFPAF